MLPCRFKISHRRSASTLEAPRRKIQPILCRKFRILPNLEHLPDHELQPRRHRWVWWMPRFEFARGSITMYCMACKFWFSFLQFLASQNKVRKSLTGTEMSAYDATKTLGKSTLDLGFPQSWSLVHRDGKLRACETCQTQAREYPIYLTILRSFCIYVHVSRMQGLGEGFRDQNAFKEPGHQIKAGYSLK